MRRHLLPIAFLMLCLPGYANKINVKNIDELNNANTHARPGDTIVLKNGAWKDVSIRLSCTGDERNPIVFMAETLGKVIITGHSQLKIGGAYIIVQGLYFTNGYSGNDQSVIDFRIDKDHLANHCRVTETSINSFNNPKRMDDNDWVSLYGKNNRVDHCSFENKLNMGVLMAVLLDDDRSRENFHSIDHNYFGKRMPLASNGGEIIRVGLAQHCQYSSNTRIANNFFEYCDGEAEIISIKSGENMVSGNFFKESQGSVVLRHGDNNTVANNIFWGNGKEATGGVRVINKGQWVVNNFFYKCTGVDFRAPLSVMNGIPNSPALRYVQVQDAVIANNTFYRCAPLSLCEGTDAERTLPPTRSVIANNIFYNSINGQLYHSYDKLDGINFTGNLYTGSKQALNPGFTPSVFTMQMVRNVQVPMVSAVYPIPGPLQEVSKARLTYDLSERPGLSNPKSIDSTSEIAFRKCGAKWYKPVSLPPKINFTTVNCNSAEEIYKQLDREGPVHIKLTANFYKLSRPFLIDKPVKFSAAGKSAIQLESDRYLGVFVIAGGGRLQLQGLSINGEGLQATHFICNDSSGSSLPYSLFVSNCSIEAIDRSKGCQDIFYAHKSMVADSIVFSNNRFANDKCDVVLLNSEKDDKGYYGAEKIIFEKNILENIQGTVLNVYRGGADESTLGPGILFTNNSLLNVLNRDNLPLIQFYGVQGSQVSGSQFKNSNPGGILIKYTDIVRARHILEKNSLIESGKIEKNKYVTAKFEPPGGKVILFVGQELEAIGGTGPYRDGYFDHFPAPGGFTQYTSFFINAHSTGLPGLTSLTDWGDGPENMSLTVNDPGLKNSCLAIGLDIGNGTDSITALGGRDSLIYKLGHWLKGLGKRPVFLRIGYEFDGHAWNHYKREFYIPAFKRIRDKLDSMQVQNVAYVWQSKGEGASRVELDAFYPGDNYVDWVAYSYFIPADSSHPMLQFARDHKKPLFIAESSPVFLDSNHVCRPLDLSKDADVNWAWKDWFMPYFRTIKKNQDVVKAIHYINSPWKTRPLWKNNPYFKNIDARITRNEKMKQLWLSEITGSLYLNASGTLFDQLYQKN